LLAIGHFFLFSAATLIEVEVKKPNHHVTMDHVVYLLEEILKFGFPLSSPHVSPLVLIDLYVSMKSSFGIGLDESEESAVDVQDCYERARCCPLLPHHLFFD